MTDELRQMLAVTSEAVLWMPRREYAKLHGLDPHTISRRDREGDIPSRYRRGNRKSLRYWRYYDPYNHATLLGIEPPEET